MKTSKILSAFAILALVSVGCHNDDTPSVKTAEISANVSGHATYSDDDATQDYTWTEGSTVALVNESKTVKYEISSGVGSVSAKFRGEDLNGTAKFAGSPFSEGSAMEDGEFCFEFPSVQHFSGAINSTELVTPNDVKVLVAGRTANGQTFDFRNVAAFIRVPVVSDEGTCVVDSVEVIAKGGVKIAGKSKVVWDEDGTPTVTVDQSGVSSSKVIFDQPFNAGTEPVYVNVPVVPSALEAGFRVTVYTKIGNSKTFETPEPLASDGILTVEPISCGNSFAILIDGPSFNTKIKEYVAGITGEPQEQLDTNETSIRRIAFNVNAEMPADPSVCVDLSQRQDGTILADYVEEDQVLNVYTGAASMAVVSGSNMFHGLKALEEIDGIECLDTYGATAMKHMFSQSGVKKLDLSSFNNANATGLDSMFWRCRDLEELILSDNFVTPKVLRAAALFHTCTSLKSVDVSKFDLSNCASISQMYQNCWSMESIDCPLDASACTTVSQMFYNCRYTKHIDLSKFKTSEKLVSTRYMFYSDTAIRGTLDMSNMYTLKDTCFFYAMAGMGKVDTIIFGEDFKLDAALKRAETKQTPLQYFFGYTSTATSTTCYVGAGRTEENPTVVVSSRLFLQQLMKNSMTGPKIQMKNGKIKYVNYLGHQYTLKTKDDQPIDIKDINTSTTTYVVVDPDEPTK